MFNIKNKFFFQSLIVVFWVILSISYAAEKHKPQLAVNYSEKNKLIAQDYYVSEKLDGVRAYWDGQNLLTKNHNIIHAPKWFTEKFPKQPLEGELWIARSRYESVISTISKDKAVDNEWRMVKFMLFDLPASDLIFEKRISVLLDITHLVNVPWLEVIKQKQFHSMDEIFKYLEVIESLGGEGLILHKKDSIYRSGRNSNLIKLKYFEDKEAVVVKHLPGKGKYKGVMGALLVELPNGKQFKLGTGFTDEQRKNPPKVGEIVTFRFNGETQMGIPKFARFLRVRVLE